MKLQGSEKQIAWAEDIVKAFKVKTKRELEFLNKKRSELSEKEKSEENTLSVFLGVDQIKLQNRKEARQERRNATTKEEKKAISKKYDEKFLKDVEQKFNDELKINDAGYWIEHHKVLATMD